MLSGLLMRTLRTLARGAAAMAAFLAFTGCEDQLPTITGADRFPEGSLPTTVEVFLDPEQFLREDTVFTDFADPLDAPFLLVAEDFDGSLDAHSLARFTGFPDSVFFTVGGASRSDTAFTYGPARVITTVNASASSGPARLQLWTLEQPWDSAEATWTVAQRRGGAAVPWRVPGGTRGRLLAEATWTPGDTVARDSVVFRVDSLAVAQIASDGFPGLLVTSATPGTRVQLSRLVLETVARPAARPDTTLARTQSAGPQRVIFAPESPRPMSAYRIGGLPGARTVLRLDLSARVPGCANPATTPACPQIPLRDVTLNRASLVLQPLAVPAGFRPLGPTALRVRRVVETELGRRAPLGESFVVDSIPASAFASPAGEAVALELTSAVAQVAATDSAVITVALLAEPEGGQFGTLWFEARPRLRLVYTLPLRPRLP